MNDLRVEYVEADLFDWELQETYDVCFFSFWLSHVPEECFEEFWEKVRSALAPNGRVFFIDSLRSDKASAPDHELPEPERSSYARYRDRRRSLRGKGGAAPTVRSQSSSLFGDGLRR